MGIEYLMGTNSLVPAAGRQRPSTRRSALSVASTTNHAITDSGIPMVVCFATPSRSARSVLRFNSRVVRASLSRCGEGLLANNILRDDHEISSS